jgi:MFS superfamily sulfate permease-like transporter
MYGLGWEQFVPFMVTIIAIVFTDLLTGIGLGLLVGLGFALHHSYRNSYHMNDIKTTEDGP